MAIQTNIMVYLKGNIRLINKHTNFAYKLIFIEGVSHGDEKIYLFPSRMADFPKTLPTRNGEQLQKAMIEMWVNFARTG